MVLIACVATVMAGAVVWMRQAPGRAFDTSVWQDEASIAKGARLAMADRLLANGLLIGMSRAEVVGQLGEPPPTAYFSDWDLVYWLGPERGYMGIDSEWLVLRLDSDGRVAEQRIVTD
jgi:hypothetical protein